MKGGRHEDRWAHPVVLGVTPAPGEHVGRYDPIRVTVGLAGERFDVIATRDPVSGSLVTWLRWREDGAARAIALPPAGLA